MTHTGNNLIGEPLDKFVYDEINNRQTNQYSGLDKNNPRSPYQQQYLNNTNSWVKLASSVEVGIDNKKTKTNEGVLGTERLKTVGLNPTNFIGTELAKKFILFNGVSELGKPNNRAGIANNTKLWNSNSSYGLGGTEFGIQPTPGIQSIDIKSLNRGSIRRATIELKAYNKFQFEIIELLYLRIGYHVMLEWGNNHFFNPKTSSTENIENTIIEDSWFKKDNVSQLGMIRTITDYRQKYFGNYDGFFGRVVNFNWSFEKDGSYSISIELATVGDLIESLNVNLPANIQKVVVDKQTATTGEKEELSKNLDSLLDEWLYKEKLSSGERSQEGEENYFSLNNAPLWTYLNLDREAEDNGELPFDKYTDYVRLGEFLNCLENWVVPIQKGDGNEKGEPQILINTNPDEQYIAYHPNQISLDPKICLIKPRAFGGDNTETEGINYPPYFNPLATYYVNDKGLEAGKIMNIYLNFHFITSTLKKHINNKGELSLFKYIQAICDGISIALGNVNNLEPILKEDKILNIVDQNPIPGVIEKMESKVKDTIIPLEIYGYNKTSKQSTFVTDISFNTSITPELGAMMTIGATAGGSTAKGTDATAFSKWNAGLQDRFNRDIEYNSPVFSIINPTKLRQVKEDAKTVFKNTTSLNKIGRFVQGAFFSGGMITNIGLGSALYEDQKGEIKSMGGENDIPKGDYTLKGYMEAAGKSYIYKQRTKASKNKLEDNSRYISYLASAFGGRTPIQIGDYSFFKPPSYSDSKYLKFDDSFISRGRTVYKTYLADLNSRAYKKAEKEAKKIKDLFSSNQNGFIPIKLDITLQGISGIKIYNKISIDQRFLPENYPNSVHFIITNVDHVLSNNSWETKLSTISIPKTNTEDIYNKLEPLVFKGDFIDYSGKEGVLPIGERGPKFKIYPPKQNYYPPFKYLEGRNANWKTGTTGKPIKKEDILKDLHPEVRPNFQAFFEDLERDYKGFKMIINSTQRTPSESQNLKKAGRKNARPYFSLHNYGLAIDFNLITPGVYPNGNKILKKDKHYSDWVNFGIPDIAQQHGILWGGNIKGYMDNVHFYFNLEIANTNVNELLQRWKDITNKQEGKYAAPIFDIPIYKDIL